VAPAWLLHQPAVTATIVGPRTRDQFTAIQRALDLSLSDDAIQRLDEIWPGPGGEAPQAYAW
jgi:aryl-alcohol dehydrogenase-like predicted oxidoreductase